MSNETQSAEIAELAAALSAAQGEFDAAAKDKANPHFSSKYADLSACIEAVRPHLARHGLAVVQTTVATEKEVILRTALIHKSGQWIASYYPIIGEWTNPQKIGSVLTYARRYTFSAILMIAQDDDDGEAAMGRGASASGRDRRPDRKPDRRPDRRPVAAPAGPRREDGPGPRPPWESERPTPQAEARAAGEEMAGMVKGAGIAPRPAPENSDARPFTDAVLTICKAVNEWFDEACEEKGVEHEPVLNVHQVKHHMATFAVQQGDIKESVLQNERGVRTLGRVNVYLANWFDTQPADFMGLVENYGFVKLKEACDKHGIQYNPGDLFGYGEPEDESQEVDDDDVIDVEVGL